ncbi:MAG: hypothetical protein ABMA64_09010 [Myxococcota bacterium]
MTWLLLVPACSEWDIDSPDAPTWGAPNPPEPPARIQTDRILQVTEPVVDLLWIVDTSPSMSEDRERLATAFPKFVQWFVEAPVDWHLGVVTTDMESGHGELVERDGVRFVTRDTPDPELVFAHMITGLDSTTLKEEGREAAWTAIDLLGEDENAGFLHDDSYGWLHFSVVSDEDDDSDRITTDQFVDWVTDLRPYTGHVSFNSVVSTIEVGPETRGDDYLELTERLGGVAADINQSDWPELLEQLGGLQLPVLRTEFFLSLRPVPESLEIHVMEPTGATLTFLAGDFRWDESRNSVSFTSYTVPVDSRVEITYLVASDG